MAGRRDPSRKPAAFLYIKAMRINDQWRICFKRQNSDAHEVEITDYHQGATL